MVPLTVALNDCVCPLATEAVDGVTVTLATVGWRTVTAAVPLILVLAVDVALTVNVEAVSFAATVKRPLELMLVPIPPPLTVHVTI